jgi:hypothetical protein
MNNLDPRFGTDLYEVYVARAHVERAKFVADMLSRVPGLIRKLVHRAPAPKLGATKAMATACGART